MTTRSLSFPAPLDCAAVDARLVDWLDDPAPDPALDRHLATCARCQVLVDELRAVSAAAAALPPIAPPAHLWDGIAARLGAQEAVDAPARVLDFDTRRVHGRLRRRDVPPAWRLAAAAVVLVAATAGVTYRLARLTPGASSPAPVAAAPVPVATRAVVATTPEPAPETVPEPALEAVERAPRRSTRRPEPEVPVVAVANPDAVVPGVAAYDHEIAALRAAVRERRGDLDSATVAVLVRNLRVIDEAIAQSRAALARDPHSPFLGDQLTRALGQKVDLLRTAALLPRT